MGVSGLDIKRWFSIVRGHGGMLVSGSEIKSCVGRFHRVSYSVLTVEIY